jgi:hypothetical protein
MLGASRAFVENASNSNLSPVAARLALGARRGIDLERLTER